MLCCVGCQCIVVLKQLTIWLPYEKKANLFSLSAIMDTTLW